VPHSDYFMNQMTSVDKDWFCTIKLAMVCTNQTRDGEKPSEKWKTLYERISYVKYLYTKYLVTVLLFIVWD